MSAAPRNKRPLVLITGASGLIGTRTAHELKNDFDLVGMDPLSPRDLSLQMTHISSDLTDDRSVDEALIRIKSLFGHQIASVIHLAAYYDFSGEPSDMYEELTVEGTRRILQGLRNHRFDVGQFVFSSSLLVMKPNEEGHSVSEFSATRAEWAYPHSKLAAEKVIHEEQGDISSVILRIAGVYDEQCHSLPISQQIARIYERQFESYVFPGDASHGQALVHLKDLGICFRKVIENRTRLNDQELFLIAEPDVMSYAELQDQIGELIHGEEWPTIRIPKALAKVGAYVQGKLQGNGDSFIKPWMIDLADDHYAANISHARVKLDWEPEHRLRETLPAMIDCLKHSPEEFYRENKLPMPSELTNHS